jgi:hypothetical protein
MGVGLMDVHLGIAAADEGGSMTKRELERLYEEAIAEKIAVSHEDDPDCECPPCDRARELYFTLKHFDDDAEVGA